MYTVLRAVVVYLVVLFFFRITGKRGLDTVTPFELILMWMMGGVAVPAMQGEDRSMTNALLLISTLVGCHLTLAWAKRRSRLVEKIIEGTPMIVMQDGKRVGNHMEKMLIHDQDVLQAGRQQGIVRMDQVKYAVVERTGSISVIPQKEE